MPPPTGSALNTEFAAADGLSKMRILAAAEQRGLDLNYAASSAGLSPQAQAELRGMSWGERRAWADANSEVFDRAAANRARPAESLRMLPASLRAEVAREYAGRSQDVSFGRMNPLPPMVQTARMLQEEGLLPAGPVTTSRAVPDARLRQSETDPPESVQPSIEDVEIAAVQEYAAEQRRLLEAKRRRDAAARAAGR